MCAVHFRIARRVGSVCRYRFPLVMGLAFGLLLVVGGKPGWAGGGTTSSSRPAPKPPYYRGELPSGAASIAYVPIGVAPSPGIPGPWQPMAALERLASAMTARLGSLESATAIALQPAGGKAVAPVVHLGCAMSSVLEECSQEPRENLLTVTSGSRAWRQQLRSAAESVGANRILVLQLQVAPHWIHQRNLKGAKEVRLGTGYVQHLPWLTSLDTPVYVLQVSGAVVDAEGKVLRGGAEGIWALRTPFRAAALRVQKLLSEQDVEFVHRDLRRTDLAGTPLVWETALDELVAQLGGRTR